MPRNIYTYRKLHLRLPRGCGNKTPRRKRIRTSAGSRSGPSELSPEHRVGMARRKEKNLYRQREKVKNNKLLLSPLQNSLDVD